MNIRPRRRGPVVVVDVSVGSEPGGRKAALHDELARLLDAGELLFVLNLTRWPALDSEGLGELVACRERVRKHEGTVKLVLTAKQSCLVAASELDSLFETFHEEYDALDSFAPWHTTAGIP